LKKNQKKFFFLMAKKAGRRLYYKQALKLFIVNLYLKNK
jgi:hypothetical protein